MNKETILEDMKEKPKFYPYVDIILFVIMVGFTILVFAAPYLFPR